MTEPTFRLQRREFITASAVGGMAALTNAVVAQAQDADKAKDESPAADAKLPAHWKEFDHGNNAEMDKFAAFIDDEEPPLSGMTRQVLQDWRNRLTNATPNLVIRSFGWCRIQDNINTLQHVATILYVEVANVRVRYRLGPMATVSPNSEDKCNIAIRRYYRLLSSAHLVGNQAQTDYRVRLPSRDGNSEFRRLFHHILRRRTPTQAGGDVMIDMHICSKPISETRNGSFLIVE